MVKTSFINRGKSDVLRNCLLLRTVLRMQTKASPKQWLSVGKQRTKCQCAAPELLKMQQNLYCDHEIHCKCCS